MAEGSRMTVESKATQTKGTDMNVLRQGDVLLIAVREPKGAQFSEPKADVILAYGEVTGHAHRIKEFTKVRVWDAEAERYIRAIETTTVTHEEHAPITLEAGVTYRQFYQTEERGEEIRRVAD